MESLTDASLRMPEPDSPPLDPDFERKKLKKAEKARRAWFTFAGRVIAQLAGAVASVVLGLIVLQRYQANPDTPKDATVAAVTSPAASVRARRPGGASIAVLPLDNLSGNEAQEYFVDGMTEAVVAGLARVDGLRVISRTSTTRYKTEHPPIPEIARALGVDLVIEGSVLQADNRVRITVQLIDGATDEHLWAESYTRTLKDVIALQDTVARAIATEIKGAVNEHADDAGRNAGVVDPAAYDLYLGGRHAWNLRTPEAMATALSFFQRAIALQPDFALAHVGVADTYVLDRSPSTPLVEGQSSRARARDAAMRALELDPSLAEAHTTLGGVLLFGERDFDGAEQAFLKAIELNRNYPVAHEWFGILLSESRRHDEADRESRTAVTLDPLVGSMHQGRGMVLYNGRKFDDAAAAERRALELTPQLPLARLILLKALALGPRPAEALPLCANDQDDPRTTAETHAACGVAAARARQAPLAEARLAALKSLRPLPSVALAQVHSAAGDYASAFQSLDTVVKSGRVPPNLAFDPMFDELRKQPQWSNIEPLLAPASRQSAIAP